MPTQGQPQRVESAARPFRIDLEQIRARAREKMSDGAVTEAYTADRTRVISVLNEALATEIVCVLRYKNHYFMARGIPSQSVAAEFLAHANEEQGHADSIAARIAQLGGVPNLNPEGLASRSHSEYREVSGLESMIKEDLVAERIAIETYAAIVRWLGEGDPTTRRLMEDILKVEEEHADDLSNLLENMNGAKRDR
ncbi:MAG TPA: ferritin-like domain-containing protein [Polyangiaceae bacterium]|nr:ferritin-like domain-containing protein [Polyangiaceae bacterium]